MKNRECWFRGRVIECNHEDLLSLFLLVDPKDCQVSEASKDRLVFMKIGSFDTMDKICHDFQISAWNLLFEE